MKKKAVIAAALCLAAGLTGCGETIETSSSEIQAPSWLDALDDENAPAGDSRSEDNEIDDEEENEEEEETCAVKEPSPAPPAKEGNSEERRADEFRPEPDSTGFRYGVWWANDGSGDRYFCFAKVNRMGSVYSQADGSGVDFDYDVYGNTVIFHMNGGDSTEKAMARWIDGDSFVLQWEDGRVENARFYSDIDYDEFFHYANSDLAALALDYFESLNGWRPAYAESDIGEGGLVVVTLYDGDECVERFALDRFTAAGTNISGDAVALDQA